MQHRQPSLVTKLFYGFGSVAFGVKDNGFAFFLLCIPGQWHRRLALLFGAAYVAVALAQLGILPKAFVLRETPL